MRSSARSIILGVDGGGSGCRAAVADARGQVLAQAEGGPANVTTDLEQAARNVVGAIRAALSLAALGDHVLRDAVAHVGLAGVMSPDQAACVASCLPIARCTVTDDRPTSLAGALGAADGALVAIGTGTFIAARRDGVEAGVGGWGFQVSDQASGGWLGRGLLEHVLLCHDGMAGHTGLTKDIMARFGDAPGEIVAFARKAGPGDYAALAPEVIEAAETGDPAGIMLMRRGSRYIDRAFRVIGLGGDDVVCLAGGVGPHYRPYMRRAFVDRLVPPLGTALDGALRLARQAYETQEAT
ncbi:BadF/BadG/BcrA/BcrD ATPase family protein [Sulfitobacter sp. D35]|uniref:BadF/BadG/BcrA/BcrD ATPase family protein n=1 Tax=Sulfitobacter sp. D35 TaxID=3083252 RepID=UPI00296FAB1C|nr:BadF/BadG/BcrA/BcrD ATPase family protein [Sulfitobacter sp. D35]MDW4498480.1 BadF/BadG/BcrA/BcrD ATPase family protein [Sulfitobacter sp. D35]